MRWKVAQYHKNNQKHAFCSLESCGHHVSNLRSRLNLNHPQPAFCPGLLLVTLVTVLDRLLSPGERREAIVERQQPCDFHCLKYGILKIYCNLSR